MSFSAIAAKHAGSWPEPQVSCASASGTPFWKLVLKQFDDLLVKVGLIMRRTVLPVKFLSQQQHNVCLPVAHAFGTVHRVPGP